jgi:cellulose synthase/poly-beta-1,6-N-acetylglucosamine synthase-like glycosyltransferase
MVHLVKALDELDYPAEKKDVQLLLEADDTDTLAAVGELSLPPGFRVTLIPPSEPRTKPKACNIGLARARGEYLVIYDAEDHPEPDQLKKAVAAFDQLGPQTVCLQSKLNFYNPRQNLLTRWFTAEYCSWFDLALPGLAAIGAVIPLGGTSNHFVTEKLREMHGWDAFNVTEDCDLGVRIYRKGYRSSMLNTTTWEEACGSLPFWIRQRTRWLKGYIQTYFVHMRNPFRLIRDLGFAGFLHFQILIGGVVLSFLINPLYWILAVLWFSLRLDSLEALFPGLVFAMGALCLFVGNFVFIYTGAVACYRRGYYDLVKHALLTPFYWVLMSISSWRAFLQFFSKPFYWEKTRHGLFKRNAA